MLQTPLCADGSCGEGRGKAILFSPGSNINQTFTLNPSDGVVTSILSAPADKQRIEVWLWNATPNYAMTGRTWYTSLLPVGGVFNLFLPSGAEGISFFAYDSGASATRALCISQEGTIVTAHGWA